jgi:PPOX class probable F420-dependent enzyme
MVVMAVLDKFFAFVNKQIFSRKKYLDGTRSDKAKDVLNVAPVHSGFESLDGHKYMLLVTYKRNGDAVPMPVWFGRQNEKLFVWTEINAYKAKRLRNDERAIVAPCGPTGEPLGPPIAARGRVLETEAERANAKQVLLGNWGFFRRAFERMSRRITDVHYIEIVPA